MTQQAIAALANAESPPTQSYVKFNGQKPPGISFPTGAGSPRKWDEQGGYGYSGATLIYMGNGLSEFDVVVQLGFLEDLATSPHWAAWSAFATNVLARAPVGTKAKSIDIEHPLLNRQPLNITKVVILDVTQFEQVKPGLWECRIKCKDARVAKPALAKAGGIPPVGAGGAAGALNATPEDVAIAKSLDSLNNADIANNAIQKKLEGLNQ